MPTSADAYELSPHSQTEFDLAPTIDILALYIFRQFHGIFSRFATFWRWRTHFA